MNLRALAKDKPCVCCGRADDTVVLHHVRLPGNAGVGKKPEDFPWGVRVCGDCHHYLHNAGRADHRQMALAIGLQMLAYVNEGVLKL